MNFENINYNPDILTCLANLSNDEVFTPPKLANQILDLLPNEIWSDKNATFLDPATKSGVFLREITKRLIKGLEAEIPDLQIRINHILTKQVFAIAITEITALTSRRTLYCAKKANSEKSICNIFSNEFGNIKFDKTNHSWKNGKCQFCGANQQSLNRGEELETHAYQFIHNNNPEKIFNMKFDVIIGNPPYQISDGGSGNGISAKPIYHKFIEQAKKLNPRFLTMIIPSRWFAGGKGLDEFRDEMLNDKRISHLVDYPKSRDVFPGVDVAGGICYFLWQRDYKEDCKFTSVNNGEAEIKIKKLNEFKILIRSHIGVEIINKVILLNEKKCSDIVFSRNPFGFTSNSRGERESFKDSLSLISSEGISYVKKSEILKNQDLIGKYKVMIGKINPDRGGVNNASDGKNNVITKVKIVNPNQVFTESYLLLDAFDNKESAINCANYYRSKFVRFLIFITLSSMNISKDNFQFLPVQDFMENWNDDKLYKKYGLTDNEIKYIESIIKPMELSDD